MKNLTIQSMRLKNFKGVSSLALEPYGQSMTIAGRNETGKTTTFDALTWLLFSKDSQGKADFSIKPQDESGSDIHNLDTEVDIAFDMNGKPITLMKRFKEKWVKKHGAARPEFTGHTTDHFIDEVPSTKKAFDAKVAEIIDAEVFQLVTNPFAFNDLHWTKRREFLLAMCGDVSDGDVLDHAFPDISQKDSFNNLANILNSGTTIDDHKKKVKAQQKKINDELEQIPVRIDELTESIKDAKTPDTDELSRLEKLMGAEKEKLRQIQSNERLSAKRAELSDVNAQISKILAQAGNKEAEAKKGINAELDNLQTERRTISGQIEDLKSDIERDRQRNRVTNDALDKLRNDWRNIQAENTDVKTDCPTCLQQLPEDQIRDAKDRLNQNKAKRLEANQAEGKSLKETFETRKKLIAESEVKVSALEKALADIENGISEKEHALKEVYVPVADHETDALYKKKDQIESEISALKNGSKVQEKGCLDKIADLQTEWSALKTAEAAWQAAEKARARIDDLGKKEKKLAAEYEALAMELHLIEKFTVAKVAMVEDQINSRFGLARFKLFKEQINGGIEECCETMYRGVQYNSGLNNAARINVGLDIIQTLSDFYGVSAPVFIDNAESVNDLIHMSAQVISLVVSRDPELTVETKAVLEAS